jgi:hypothetical protein
MTTRTTCGKRADNFIARKVATDAAPVNPHFIAPKNSCRNIENNREQSRTNVEINDLRKPILELPEVERETANGRKISAKALNRSIRGCACLSARPLLPHPLRTYF